MIYTFYSFKGGVGRTMALANVAELFYRAGLKVLMVDWDLESPGLEQFFPIHMEMLLETPGVMDMLLEYKRRMAAGLTGSEREEHLLADVLEASLVEVYPDASGTGRLWLFPAGKRLNEHLAKYARSILTFDWLDFYQNWEGEVFFEWLRKQFERIADIVLIDSRTGMTEIGGVCTYQLADVIVMLCAPNRQNLNGTCEMAQRFRGPWVQELRSRRSLDVLIVPARIELGESALLDKFHEEFVRLFEPFVPRERGIDIHQLWQAGIPYIPKYAFAESVAVREVELASTAPMAASFRQLSQLMARLWSGASYLESTSER